MCPGRKPRRLQGSKRRNEASVLLKVQVVQPRIEAAFMTFAEAVIALHPPAITFLPLQKGNVTMPKVHKILADGDTCLVVDTADMIRLFERRDLAQPDDGDAGSLRDVERLLLVRADKDDPAMFSSMASWLRRGSIAGGRSGRGGALPIACRPEA